MDDQNNTYPNKQDILRESKTQIDEQSQQKQEQLSQNIDQCFQILHHSLHMNKKAKVLFKDVENTEQEYKFLLEDISLDNIVRQTIFNKAYRHQQQNLTSLSKITRGLSLIHQSNQNDNDLKISSFFAWFLLVAHAFGNAVVPCWMTVQINGDGLPKTIWRNIITGIFLIPFLMYEQRHNHQQKFKLSRLLNRQNLQKYWLCSIKYSIWVLVGSFAIKLTSRAHSFCFLRLKFLLTTISKIKNQKKYHQAQIGGLFLVAIGIMMILSDSYALPQKYIQNAPYTSFSVASRFSGDLLAICGSLAILYFDSHYQLPKDPQFTSLFIYNNCLTLNLGVFSYFFGGCELTFNKPNGLLRLFQKQVFVDVFYVSIMLGLNLMIGTIMLNKIFSDFIRNMASCFQIIIITTIYHLFSIEILTSGLTCLGFSFFIPGMMLIIGGQNILQNLQIKMTLNLLKKFQSKIVINPLVSLKQVQAFYQQQNMQYQDYLKLSIHKSQQIISKKQDKFQQVQQNAYQKSKEV